MTKKTAYQLFLILFLFNSCRENRGEENKAQPESHENLISIGSVSLVIQNEILTIQPFADYLAGHLSEFGIEDGRVVVSGNLNEMAGYINSGEVDIYIDSPFPTLFLNRETGIVPELIDWKDSTEYYNSVFFVRKESEIKEFGDLPGKALAFESEYSTSGYFPPKLSLYRSGFDLRLLEKKGDKAGDKEIGYIFTGDDENTMLWVLESKVDAGATDIISFRKNAGIRMNELRVIDHSPEVPGQLVSFRKNIPEKLKDKIISILLKMNISEEAKETLNSLYSTEKFSMLKEKEFEKLKTGYSFSFRN